jgi:hypothetical protein
MRVVYTTVLHVCTREHITCFVAYIKQDQGGLLSVLCSIRYSGDMLVLDRTDTAILSALRTKQYNTSSLARKIKLNRFLVARRLRQMDAHHLVEVAPSTGKQKVWRIVVSRTRSKKTVQLFEGPNMSQAFALSLHTRPNTIIYTIEGSEFARITNAQQSFIHLDSKIQKSYQSRRVIVKGIAHPKALEEFREAAKKHPSMALSRSNRPRRPLYLLDRKGLAGPCAIISLPTALKLYNQRKKYALVIRDEEMARALYDVMEFLHDLLGCSKDVPSFDLTQLAELIYQTRHAK